MRALVFILLLTSMLIFGCKKQTSIESCTPVPESWEKFEGNYNVYDTNGVFLYDMSIDVFFSGLNQFNNPVDSMVIQDFADTMDYKFEYFDEPDPNFLNYGFKNAIKDYNNKTWNVSIRADDTSTTIIENTMTSDTIVFYFRMTNLAYYIPEAVPFFECYCKHVAVKQ